MVDGGRGLGAGRRRRATVALISVGVGILALLTVFAIELSNTQAKSKRDVERRVHERAVLAAALIDSLFQTVMQQIPQDERTYGAPVITSRTLDAHRQTNLYLVVLDSGGHVLAASQGFTPQARAELSRSAALALVRSGHPYGIGNVLPYGRTGVINLAVAFPSASGTRIVLTGFVPTELGPLLAGELRQIPGVPGAHNYLIDGEDTVLASTNPRTPTGYRFTSQDQVAALSRASGERDGHYYDAVPLANSTWRIVLGAPVGPLFASVSGLRKWLPWLIFVAFGLVAAAALALGAHVVRSAESDLRAANARLRAVNEELAVSNLALEQRAEQLARSNDELEAFSYSVAHDLRAPLRSIDGFSRVVLTRYAPVLDDEGRGMLARVGTATGRMSTLIDALLSLARLSRQTMHRERVDITVLAQEIVSDLRAAEPERRVEVTVADGMVALGDRELLRMLLQNLLENAFKFTAGRPQPRIEVAPEGEGFVVRDNGVGFDMEFSEKLFRPFERLHEPTHFAGTGVGLATVLRIVQRHGGTVRADARPDDGAAFYFTLSNGARP